MTIERDSTIDIKEGPNYDIWRLPLASNEQFQTYSLDQKLNYLLNFGVMAGSTHNTQPEAFSLNPEGGSISVFLDKSRVLPASDVKGRQACISTGWAITNINIASRYFHLEPNVTVSDINPEDVKPNQEINKRYIEIAKIKLSGSPSVAVDIKSLQALQTRRVNRKTYDTTRAIPPPILEHIKNIAESGTTLHLIMKGDLRIIMLAELQAQADGFVANNEKFANELAGWLLPNDTDSYYGMPGDTFNLDNQTTREIRDGLADISKRNSAVIGGFSRSSKKGIESAAFVGMLTCRDDIPTSWVKAGITLGRIANVLEQEGVSIAIHAGLAEVGWISTSFAKMSRTSEKPVILFRAGYSQKEAKLPPHTPRANIESFLVT